MNNQDGITDGLCYHENKNKHLKRLKSFKNGLNKYVRSSERPSLWSKDQMLKLENRINQLKKEINELE